MLILYIQKLHEIKNGMLRYLLVKGIFKKNQWDQTSFIRHLGFMFLGNQYTVKQKTFFFLNCPPT